MNIEVKRCTALADLFTTLEQVKPPVYYLAGGTDVMVWLHSDIIKEGSTIIDISDIPELHGISLQGDNLVIGAGVTHAELAESELVRRYATALAEAASNVGGPQIRNRGTIGGNIANGSPAADTMPSLLSLGATLRLVSAKGERMVEADKYPTGYRRSVLAEGEIIQSISIPVREGLVGHWKALAQRKALAISKLSLAVSAVRQGEGFSYLRIGMGSVAATAQRALKAEEVLLRGGYKPEVVAEACQAIVAEVNPISDVRSTAEYRKAMCGVVLGDLLTELFG